MLKIPGWLLTQMHKHVMAEHPLEATGIVTRKKNDGQVDVYHRHTPMKNVHRNPRLYYAWDPNEQVKVFDMMDAEGTDPWIIYHSHTEADPTPSQTDRNAAWFPDVHYLIFSTVGGPEDVWYESWRCTEPGLLVLEEVQVTE